MEYVNATELHEKVAAPWFDHYVSMGSAAQAVFSVMARDSSIELHIKNGKITVLRNSVELGSAGIEYCEPTADAWYGALGLLRALD